MLVNILLRKIKDEVFIDLIWKLLRAGYDTEHGIDRTFGYQFFTKKVSCVVIFELLQCHSEWLTNRRVDLPALMNAILEYWPEYAVTFNAHEQAGLNDGDGLFLCSMGIRS